MAVVITREWQGIYLGHCMGLGFWSCLDGVGQPSAITFPDEATAIQHIRTWENQNDPAGYAFRQVTPTDGEYATVADLRAAGLGDLIGDMVEAPKPRPAPQGREPAGPSL